METSDSDCFESADEDFQSDSEPEVTSQKSEIFKEINVVQEKIGAISVKNDDMHAEKIVLKESNVKKGETIAPEENEEIKSNVTECIIEKSKPEVCNAIKEKKEKHNNQIEKECQKNILEANKNAENTEPLVSQVDAAEKTSNLGEEICNIKKPKPSKITKKTDEEVKREKMKLGTKTSSKTEEMITIKNKETKSTKTEETKTIKNEETKITKTEESHEENLWDEEEIDWGKEAQIEENLQPKKTNEDMWGADDDWEPVEKIEESSHKMDSSSSQIKTFSNAQSSSNVPESDGGWGGWGNWGVSSILTTATQSVSTITNHVSQGISTVLETGMGVPDPEELARQNKLEKERIFEKLKENPDFQEDDYNTGSFGLGNFVSGVSKFVESTSTKVISGGLDTLETIGKKTMEVLQEGDPGFKKKRALLKLDQNKPILSQVLREAKEKAEQDNKKLEQRCSMKKVKNYETLFDDHQGLVHLEALEMLSRQCSIKLECLSESLTGDPLTEMQETMDQIKELCELPEEDDEETLTMEEIREKLENAVSEIKVPITYEKLMNNWQETSNWLSNLDLEGINEKELHQKGIEALAQLTAISVEQFHKCGELLLVKERRSTADEADSLVQLTTTLISFIGIVASNFTDKLSKKDCKNKEDVRESITNIFFEASNSSSYIKDAFQLLVPVLQVGAI